MAKPQVEFWSGKILYPVIAILFVVSLVAIARCPMAHPVAPDFSLALIGPDGHAGPDRMALRDLRGHPVVLDFWATWCSPCQFETPILVRLHQRFRERGVVVVGINVDEAGPGTVPTFRRRFGIDYPLVYDEGQVVSGRYQIQGLPTLVLIDRAGRIRRVHTGISRESDLAQEIAGML